MYTQDTIGQVHLLSSLLPLLCNLVRPDRWVIKHNIAHDHDYDRWAIPAGQVVTTVSAASLLLGGVYWQEGTAVLAALLLVLAKTFDR